MFYGVDENAGDVHVFRQIRHKRSRVVSMHPQQMVFRGRIAVVSLGLNRTEHRKKDDENEETVSKTHGANFDT